MNKETFISEALYQYADVLPYYVGQKLSTRYPETPIITGEDIDFDLEAFERAKQCEIVSVTDLHNQIKTEWRGTEKSLRSKYENAWLNVLWQDHFIDVVFVTFIEAGYRTRYHWIIAETQSVGEKFLHAVCEWSSEVRSEILVFDDGWWEKDEDLFKAIKSASFENLILPDELKQGVINDFDRFIASRAAYQEYNIPWKRGILFVGPPGNGKTQMVKAIVNHLNLPCLYIKSFYSSCGAEASIKRVFARARRIKPCLIVMEDIDSLITEFSRSFFLNELDGFAENDGVMVLATTNYPKKLDAALVNRPSRFDRKYHFGLPKKIEREKYLRVWSEKLHADARLSDEGIQQITKLTKKFSFAYLKELALSSLMEWMENPTVGRMNEVMKARATALQEQMKSKE